MKNTLGNGKTWLPHFIISNINIFSNLLFSNDFLDFFSPWMILVGKGTISTSIRLVGITYCLHRSRFVIGQFGCSGLPLSDAKGKPAIENEHKNIRYTLNSGLNHTTLSNCDDLIAVL